MPSTPRTSRWFSRRSILVALTIVLMLAAAALPLVTRVTPHLRDHARAALNERFDSDVELAALEVSFFPRLEIAGTGLALRHRGRTDVTPLLRIGSYSASATLWGALSSPVLLKTVNLERLEVSIPPGGVHNRAQPDDPVTAPPSASADRPSRSGLVIDRLVSRTARLEMVPRDPAKLPRVFDIHNLVMHGLGDGGGSTFEANLTNPRPRGEIATHGTIGPWVAKQPGKTPIRGEYVFRNADLNTIKGISGTLSSTGTYSGVLEYLEVKGETDTPNFSVDLAAQPVPLKTRFHAIVDGTNGDTRLERVDAHVIDTLIVARGDVVRNQDVKGRRITLEVAITNGRIEDVLKLGVKAATPTMTGRMRLQAKLVIPAGDQDVIDKIELAGTFGLDEARFTSVNIQQKINALSRRGRGDEASTDGPSVVSRLSGTFSLRDGTLTFSSLSFGVAGAIVQLAGTYDTKRELLDLRGHLLLDASLRQMSSGWQSLVAWMAQPLFRRPGGGSKLPIRISGPRGKPEFGLDAGRIGR